MTTMDPEEVLKGLPDSLWQPLLEALRIATDRVGRTQLPLGLQPYAGFTPARLGQGRAKAAVIEAVAADARLRDAIGRALGDGMWERAETAPAADLVERFGPARAAAALVARSRWDDVAGVTAAAPAPAPRAPAGPQRRRDDEPQVAALRRERDTAQRRAAAAEKRAADLQSDLATARRQVEELHTAHDALLKQADQERSRSRDRLARLQRRVSDAESRARVEADRFAGVAKELERLAGVLRGRRDSEQPVPPVATAPAAAPAGIPRTVRAATPGRPSTLPPGILDSQPAGVHSLLSVSGIEVILDGYNVTKDMRGVPTAELADQRAWLGQLAAAVAARYDARVWIVFDGDRDRTSAAAVARVVRCVFTAEGETADERIVAMVRALEPDQPVVVVTSDGEVRAACQEHGANVVASGVFLQAVA